jgi:hypothetical protein
MLQPDDIHIRLSVSKEKRAELIEVIRQHPDLFSEIDLNIPTQPPYPHKNIFINYRRSDSEDVVGRIYDRLTGEFGRGTVFKDVEDIPPGVDFRQVLEREVVASDVMLVVVGKNWANRQNKSRLHQDEDYVRFEIQMALEHNIPVIPVLVQRRVTLPRERDLPKSIRALVYRHASQVRPDPDFHQDMNRLIRGIRRIFEENLLAEAEPTDTMPTENA